MDAAFAQARAAEYGMGDQAAGVPQGRPFWVLPIIIGAAVLFLGGGLIVLFALLR
jgi:hypothetical protein